MTNRTHLSPNQFGESITLITFGESHGRAVGCVIDNVKPGQQ